MLVVNPPPRIHIDMVTPIDLIVLALRVFIILPQKLHMEVIGKGGHFPEDVDAKR